MKVAVVTGGARGIGLAVSSQLSQEGFSLAIFGRSSYEAVQTEIAGIGSEVLYFSGDLAKTEDHQAFVKKVIDTYGRVDVLVNNAGVAPKVRLDLLETTEENYDYVLDTNLKGTFFLTQLVAKQMVEQVSATSGEFLPRIINISSVSAYVSSVNRGEYCLSKAAISMTTKLFADRLAEYGIRVYEIRPGIIKTDMTAPVAKKYDLLIAEGMTPIKRWGMPEDVANAVSVFCSDKLTFSTGEVLNVDGGFHIRRL